MRYDIAVIGCGPAGAAAALMGKRNGLNVAVLTDPSGADIHPSEDVSHSVHSGVMELASRLDLQDEFSRSILSRFDQIRVLSGTKPVREQIQSWDGYHISKRSLDHELMDRLAREEGIQVIPGKATDISMGDDAVQHIQTETGGLSARFVIDASGRHRFLAKKYAFRQQRFSRPMVCQTGSEHSNGQTPDTNNPELGFSAYGWSWLAPDREGTRTWTNLYVQGEGKQGTRNLAKKLDGKGFNVTWRLHRPLAEDQAILAGDAGGILDPSSGQGIFNALLSGINAGNCASHCLRDPGRSILHQLAYDSWFVELFKSKVEALSGVYRDNGLDITPL